MAAYGVFLALCGFEYHGPEGHIGFAPRITPADFRAAFTAAEGWGLCRQVREDGGQRSTVEVRYGELAVRTVSVPAEQRPRKVRVRLGHATIPASWTHEDGTLTVTLRSRTTVSADSAALSVTYS